MTLPKCPNCGVIGQIDINWVKSCPKRESTETFKEYLKNLLDEEIEKDRDLYQFGTINISTPIEWVRDLKKYIQVVIRCKACGYTEIANPQAYLVAKEL